jgi:hypothetical protein
MVSKGATPSMTYKLAEARAIGERKGLKFAGTAFLSSHKK